MIRRRAQGHENSKKAELAKECRLLKLGPRAQTAAMRPNTPFPLTVLTHCTPTLSTMDVLQSLQIGTNNKTQLCVYHTSIHIEREQKKQYMKVRPRILT